MPTFNILESASPELRTWLLENGEAKSFSTETVLIKEGERHPSPMVLLEGRLNVTTSNQQQGQEQLSTLTPGCLVGEMSWLEKRPAVATITSSRRLHGIQALHRAARIAGQSTAHPCCAAASRHRSEIGHADPGSERLGPQIAHQPRAG